jgi:molybdopterin/thiamine biosynthesis adenylyltransferase
MKASLQLPSLSTDTSYTPLFFRLRNENEIDIFNQFLVKNTNIFVFDTMYSQLCELIKSLNPARKLTQEELKNGVEKHLSGTNIQHYGVWVYYPWANRLIHLLDEAEFIEVRTNRNQYKITREERDLLGTKKIGIVGLSVGQSIALTLAMERSFGELRIADFDDLELSNLNRIRTPLHNMGFKKVVAVAREIAELDPFLKLTIFDDGLTDENMDRFFNEGGKLDILVDECDGLDMKIMSRYKARELGIPVVMDTSDRGLLDVERFDLEPNRPILHGLVGDIDPKSIKGLTNEQKIPYILPMIGGEKISPRMKASMMEVEETINTWPQLATSVILGGAVTGDVCRRILLNQYHDSGRYYIDLDELIGDKEPIKPYQLPEKPAPLNITDMTALLSKAAVVNGGDAVEKNDLEKMLTAACLAPSGGNVQPWKWVLKNNTLHLFHDEHYSFSLLDFNNYGSYVGLGAAIENLELKAQELGYTQTVNYFPEGPQSHHTASIVFNKGFDGVVDELTNSINLRLTNRNKGNYEPLKTADIDLFKKSISKIEGAEINFITDREQISKLGAIVAGADKVRMMNEQGHYNTFFDEMRWTEEEAVSTRDGIDIATVGATPSEAVGFTMAKDYRAIKLLRDWDKGVAFEKLTKKVVDVSSALALITMPAATPKDYILGGRAVQRAWLEATKLGYAFQPLSVPLFLFRRLTEGNGVGFSGRDMDKLMALKKDYETILPGFDEKGHIFMFRLGRADEPKVKSLRRQLSEVLFYI